MQCGFHVFRRTQDFISLRRTVELINKERKGVANLNQLHSSEFRLDVYNKH